MSDLNLPQRMFAFLDGLTKLSVQYGVVIEGAPTLEFKDQPKGRYCLDPNNSTNREFGFLAE